MKRTFLRTKKTLAFALTALALMTAQAQASKPDPRPVDYRRTLFAAAGQDRMIFEAPLGWCFLDPTDKKQGPVYEAISAVVRAAAHSVVVGVFAPCNSIANSGNPMGPEGDVISSGIVTWANPVIGDKMPQDLNGYIDLRAPSFREYVALNVMNWGGLQSDDTATQNMERYVLEKSARATDAGVSIGFSQKITKNAQNYDIVGAAGTTLLRHHPVELLLRLNSGGGAYTLDSAHQMMDTLLAQQVVLNPPFPVYNP